MKGGYEATALFLHEDLDVGLCDGLEVGNRARGGHRERVGDDRVERVAADDRAQQADALPVLGLTVAAVHKIRVAEPPVDLMVHLVQQKPVLETLILALESLGQKPAIYETKTPID